MKAAMFAMSAIAIKLNEILNFGAKHIPQCKASRVMQISHDGD